MQLKPYKTRKGYVLDLDKNRDRLNFWKERYGITDEDLKGDDVNVVNNVNFEEASKQETFTGLTAEEIGF
jgi:hypothetical protein